jgi:hypothetical protein
MAFRSPGIPSTRGARTESQLGGPSNHFFTEGFAIADLVAARGLLQELHAGSP